MGLKGATISELLAYVYSIELHGAFGQQAWGGLPWPGPGFSDFGRSAPALPSTIKTKVFVGSMSASVYRNLQNMMLSVVSRRLASTGLAI